MARVFRENAEFVLKFLSNLKLATIALRFITANPTVFTHSCSQVPLRAACLQDVFLGNLDSLSSPELGVGGKF